MIPFDTELGHVRRAPATYADMARISQVVLRHLRVAIFDVDQGVWESTGELMFRGQEPLY